MRRKEAVVIEISAEQQAKIDEAFSGSSD